MTFSSFRLNGEGTSSAHPVPPVTSMLPPLPPPEPLFSGIRLLNSASSRQAGSSPPRRASEAAVMGTRTAAISGSAAAVVPSTASSRPSPTYRSTTQPISIPVRASVTGAVPIPSYEDAMSLSPRSPVYGALSPRDRLASLSISAEANSYVRDTFGSSPSRITDVFAEDEDDDPLTPRSPRSPPVPNLIPLGTRRYTMPTTSPPTPTDSDASHTDLSGIDMRLPLDLPPPPEQPPGYSAHLAENELRLISTVHLEENHPAAAFFSQMTSTALSPVQPAAVLPPVDPVEQETGGKKLKLTLTSGGERVNPNGTGPLFIRMNRHGKITGRIDVGKVDHVTGLEVSILGYVNTSYYVRGQYTLIDTLPLARRHVTLYPQATAVDGFNRDLARVTSPSPTSITHVQTSTASANTTTTPLPATGDESGYASGGLLGGGEPRTIVVGKETFLAPEQTFTFSIEMPTHHYRETNVDLPPSAQIFQVGLQAGVEYVLRVKMSRKGWRMSENIGCPIVYEPRAYVSPRRLRLLTTNDALCPGWRTIRLNGGKPIKPADSPDPAPDLPAVEVSLLLPSPPILFIPDGGTPPPIPFHLHFHSRSALPLATFSDPKDCEFVIRFMRVASMRIGSEKEIRRMEVQSKVEIWQEGGPRMTLGEDKEVAPASGSSSRRPGSSGTGERRRSFAERRPSFLKRRSSAATNALSPGTSPAADTPLARQLSNVLSEPTIAEDMPAPAEAPSIVAPLGLGATDVHLLGQLTLQLPMQGPALLRNLIQSFMSPEIGISYVLEVGLQPKNGAVKEAFSHVWGGGLIEVVLGHRNRR